MRPQNWHLCDRVGFASSLPPDFLLEGGYFFELLSGEIYCPFLIEEV